MSNLKDILLELTRAIVDHPDDVVVSEEEKENETVLTLSVHPDDMGMVIGRHGRIAKAIRAVMKETPAKKSRWISATESVSQNKRPAPLYGAGLLFSLSADGTAAFREAGDSGLGRFLPDAVPGRCPVKAFKTRS